jgi:hypothetical protein
MKLSSASKYGAAVLVALSLALTGCLTDDDASEGGPSISSSPSDVTIASGSTATFTVVASGTGSLTYQWMKDGADISGAIAASYSHVALSSEDGAEFKAKVTDTKGTTTSAVAILNIRVTEQTVILGAQNNSIASSIDVDTWTAYTAGNAPANAAAIDVVFAYSTAGNAAALYSPLVAKNGVAGSAGYDFMQSWTITNNTDMRSVEVADWSTVTTSSSIKALYDAAAVPNPAGRIFVLAGTKVVVRSNLGMYVLIRVDAVIQAENGTVSLTGKAKR